MGFDMAGCNTQHQQGEQGHGKCNADGQCFCGAFCLALVFDQVDQAAREACDNGDDDCDDKNFN